jgi:hypothetical protein
MKKYGSPCSVVTEGLKAYSAAVNEIGAPDRRKVGPGLTIEWRIRTSRFDDESGRCSGFEI